MAWGLAAVCLLLLIWAGFLQLRSTQPPERQHLRLSLMPPPSTSFVPYNFAISPDGRRLAFVAAGQDGRTARWIRSFGDSAAQQLTGTENAMFPFWSPDAAEIGFFAFGKLKTVRSSGGAVRIVCDASNRGFGGTWNNRGTIVFAAGNGPMMKVPASGGTPEPVTVDEGAVWPTFLPNGDRFLYFASRNAGRNSVPNGIYAGSLSSRDRKMI